MKSGQSIILYNLHYLFLGYVDYEKKWGVAADRYGNKHIFYIKDKR